MVSNTVDISSTDPWASYIGYYTVQDQSFGRLEEAVEAVSRLKHASALREEPTKTNNSGETASCSAFEFVCCETEIHSFSIKSYKPIESTTASSEGQA